jgi:protein-tyrosine phosphatase
MDGRSSEPRNLSIQCHYDERSHESTVHASWAEPDDPQGKITEYDVVLSGNASYYGRDGKQAEDKIHPIKKVVLPNQPRKLDFPNQPPNTQIYLRYVQIEPQTKVNFS